MVTSRQDGKGGGRDREATERRILDAAGRVLARDGFRGLGVNAVAREAGVDKVLIYRYFGGIEALLDTWGRKVLGAGEPQPVADPATPPASADDRAAEALIGFARASRRNPQALEVMRWELVEDNALTRRLADLRESAGQADLARIGVDQELARAVDLPALAAVLSAGLLHIALRARTAPQWLGIPIRTKQGWERLEHAAATLVRNTLSGAGPGRPVKRPKRKP
jgi:AcrR family transcriptional regulator